MKKILSILFVLLLLFSMIPAASADRIPEERNSRYIGAMRVVKCKEWVTLRNVPYKTGKALAKVPLGAIVYNCRTIKEKKSFVYAEYEGLQGYILLQYLETAPEYEPPVTSAITQKMTQEEVIGNAEVVLDWHDFNISVLAAHEFVKEKKTTKEVLRLGCFIDGEPLWGHIETLEIYNNEPLLTAFIGGTEDDPMVMLYDGGYGLTMFDLLSGNEKWTLMVANCNLGNAAVTAVNYNDGIMYIAGTDGPDPIAVTQEGRLLWKSQVDDPEVTHPFEMELKRDGLYVKYGEDPENEYYLVVFDSVGDVASIELVEP